MDGKNFFAMFKRSRPTQPPQHQQQHQQHQQKYQQQEQQQQHHRQQHQHQQGLPMMHHGPASDALHPQHPLPHPHEEVARALQAAASAATHPVLSSQSAAAAAAPAPLDAGEALGKRRQLEEVAARLRGNENKGDPVGEEKDGEDEGSRHERYGVVLREAHSIYALPAEEGIENPLENYDNIATCVRGNDSAHRRLIAWSPWLTCYAVRKGSVRVMKNKDAKNMVLKGTGIEVVDLGLSPVEKGLLASVCKNGSFSIWRIAESEEEVAGSMEYRSGGDEDFVALQWHPTDATKLLLVSHSKVQLWYGDADKTWSVKQSFSLTDSKKIIKCAVFGPGKRGITYITDDLEIGSWDEDGKAKPMLALTKPAPVEKIFLFWDPAAEPLLLVVAVHNESAHGGTISLIDAKQNTELSRVVIKGGEQQLHITGADWDATGEFAAIAYRSIEPQDSEDDNGVIFLHIRRAKLESGEFDSRHSRFDYLMPFCCQTKLPLQSIVTGFDNDRPSGLQIFSVHSKPILVYNVERNHIYRVVPNEQLNFEERKEEKSGTPRKTSLDENNNVEEAEKSVGGTQLAQSGIDLEKPVEGEESVERKEKGSIKGNSIVKIEETEQESKHKKIKKEVTSSIKEAVAVDKAEKKLASDTGQNATLVVLDDDDDDDDNNENNDDDNNDEDNDENQGQKEIVGAYLFPIVKKKVCDQALAEKITGMLLELPEDLIKNLIEDPFALGKKVSEAQDLLDKPKIDGSEGIGLPPSDEKTRGSHKECAVDNCESSGKISSPPEVVPGAVAYLEQIKPQIETKITGLDALLQKHLATQTRTLEELMRERERKMMKRLSVAVQDSVHKNIALKLPDADKVANSLVGRVVHVVSERVQVSVTKQVRALTLKVTKDMTRSIVPALTQQVQSCLMKLNLAAPLNQAVEKRLVPEMKKLITSSMDLSSDKFTSTLTARLKKSVSAALKTGVQEAFVSSLIPSITKSTQILFEQIDRQLSRRMTDADGKIRKSLEDHLRSMRAAIDKKLTELETANVQVGSSRKSSTGNTLKDQIASVQSCLDSKDYTSALLTAVRARNSSILDFLVSNLDPDIMLQHTSFDPIVSLSLASQLCASLETETSARLLWLRHAIAAIPSLSCSKKARMLIEKIRTRLEEFKNEHLKQQSGQTTPRWEHRDRVALVSTPIHLGRDL